jgi:hypothetical protein
VIFGIQSEFLIFTALLLGVAIFHRHALTVALLGLAAVVIHQLVAGRFSNGSALSALMAHFAHEWVVLANLFALLLGFALLALSSSIGGGRWWGVAIRAAIAIGFACLAWNSLRRR